MPKQTEITMGGRPYVAREQPMGETRKWRLRLRESGVMRAMQTLDMDQADSLKGHDAQTLMAYSMMRMLPSVSDGLANSVDEVIDLLFAYVPELRADEEWLLENAYDEEAIVAFIEVLKLNFPISALWETVSGSRVQPIPMKSPARNGASGLPASGPLKKASTS